MYRAGFVVFLFVCNNFQVIVIASIRTPPKDAILNAFVHFEISGGSVARTGDASRMRKTSNSAKRKRMGEERAQHSSLRLLLLY